MKILIITPYFPYPIDTGGNNAQFLMIDSLRNSHEISLVCPFAIKSNYQYLKGLWRDVDLEILEVTDENSTNSELFLKKFYLGLKYLYHHPFASLRKVLRFTKGTNNSKSANTFEPRRENLQYWHFSQMKLEKKFVSFVNQIIQHRKFDLIQVEFTSFISFGFILPKNTIKIFVHHEIAFIRTERELKTIKDSDIYDAYIAVTSKNYELNCLEQYDGVLTFSDIDKNILQKNIKVPVFNSPFPVKVHNRVSLDNFKFRNVVFLGGEILFANRDAIEWFISNVFSNLPEQFSHIHLKVVGKWNNETIEMHKDNRKINFLGYVEDLSNIFIDSVMIVSLNIGSGIRSKILDAFSMGIPVISSSIGIEGIPAKHGVHYLKADNRDEYLEAFNLIDQNPGIIYELINNAIRDIIPLYTVDKCCEIREQIYKNLKP